MALLSLSFTWFIWQTFHLMMYVLFFAGLIVAEVFVQMRWRLSLPCPHCGFDPVLYIKNPELAADRVKNFVDEHKKRPESWLKPDPLRHLKPRSNRLL